MYELVKLHQFPSALESNLYGAFREETSMIYFDSVSKENTHSEGGKKGF
jgi:hypothetical protein